MVEAEGSRWFIVVELHSFLSKMICHGSVSRVDLVIAIHVILSIKLVLPFGYHDLHGS